MDRFTLASGRPSHGIRARIGDPGDLAGRLVALFGAPGGDAGWSILDGASGTRFHVAVDAAGISYSAVDADRDLQPSLAAFDALLDVTLPVDCAIALPGQLVVGVSSGRPFMRPVAALPADPLAAYPELAVGSPSPSDALAALLRLDEAYPRVHRGLVRALWRNAASTVVSDLERELARARPRRALLRSASVLHLALRETASRAEIDPEVELGPHAATFARAERLARKR